MYELKWREVFDPQMSKLVKHLELIQQCLSTGYEEMYDHLKEQIDEVSLVPIFASLVITIFISDLQDHTPSVATHIFDVFLIDGESVVFTLLMKFMQLQQEQILSYYEEELQFYMRKQMPFDCL